MTLTTDKRLIIFDADGTTTVFPFDFRVDDAAHLVVQTISPGGTSTTIDPANYTVTGIGVAEGGEVTYAPGGQPLTDGRLAILREVPFVQDLSITNQDGFFPQLLEVQLDQVVMQTQQLAEEIGRSVVVPVGSDVADIQTLVGGILELAPITSEIETVAGISGDVTATAGNAADISTVAGISGNVTIVAGVAAQVSVVAGIDSDITTVAGVAAEVTALAPISSDVTTVAGIASEVTNLEAVAADITTVAGITADVTAVGAIAANVTTVAAIGSDVTAVAGNAADISIVADNIGDIQDVKDALDGSVASGISYDDSVTDFGLDPADLNVQKAIEAAASKGVPVGTVAPFAMDQPPPGWLKADGSAISRTSFPDLFDAIGTTYGSGDGSTTFNLPDYRGEFLRGWDDGRGVDPGRVFGSSQLDQMQRIVGEFKQISTNFAPIIQDAGDFSGVFSQGNTTSPARPASGSGTGRSLDFNSANSPDARVSDTTDGETRSRNVAVLICIKAFDAVTDPALLDAQAVINHIDNTLEVFAQRADAAKITTRQTVLTGPVDSDGRADFLEAGSGLQVVTKDLDTTPLIPTWGDGFDGLGEKNFIAQIDSNIAWDDLPDDTDDIILFLRLSGGTVTTFHEVLAPVYGGARPSSPSEGQTWYPTDHRDRMEIYESGAWNADDLIICVGQCSTDGGSVVDVVSYTYQGKHNSDGVTLSNGVKAIYSLPFSENDQIQWDILLTVISPVGGMSEGTTILLRNVGGNSSTSGNSQYSAVKDGRSVEFNTRGALEVVWPSGYVVTNWNNFSGKVVARRAF